MSECAGKACRRSACMRLNKNVYPISSSFLLHRAVLGFSSFSLPKLSLFLPWARPRTHIHGRTPMLRLENAGGGEEKHAIWTDEEAKGEKEGGENVGKWRWRSWYHTRNKPRRRRRLWLRSSLLTRGGGGRGKSKKQKQFNLYLVGEVQIYTARGGKEKRSVIAHRRRETDRYSRFQFTLSPACKQSCGKKLFCFAAIFPPKNAGRGVCGVATQFGAQRGNFPRGRKKGKLGHAFEHLGKLVKKGVSERCRKLLKLIRLKRGGMGRAKRAVISKRPPPPPSNFPKG